MLLKDKHILIVEDNVQNRVIFTMALQKHGAQLYFERWGEGAVYQLKLLGHADVIILDLMLAKGVTGYQVFDQIRAMPEYALVPILAVSATDPGVALPLTRAKGFAGFIAKPINNRLFAEQVLTIINGGQIWADTFVKSA